MNCSADCFSVDEYTLQESYVCQKKCIKSLDLMDSKTQVAFGKFDSILNGCLHSCSKQKRKSSILSNEASICYKECLSMGRKSLTNMETYLISVYSQFMS